MIECLQLALAVTPRGATCSTNGVVTGRFIYEGVTKSFAITNAVPSVSSEEAADFTWTAEDRLPYGFARLWTTSSDADDWTIGGGDVTLRLEYKDAADVTRASVEKPLTVVKVGNVILPGEPEGGLVVLRGTSVAMEGDCPQPGFIAATHGDDWGRVGIVDFDGMGISAGQRNVNRNMEACDNEVTHRYYQEVQP